ncbi:MAG: tryptophan-rich sensory protein [Planctomycetes bacterium]|nr:tryptophan-rich sensory protein [Phycisphaerae bacterium]NBB94117.1 tryptophan-rich sensory protein [Planctomycetota bacterium]
MRELTAHRVDNHLNRKLDRHDWLGGGVLLLAAAFVAVSGSTVSAGAIRGWYAGLDKPEWSPPNWVFGPVWTVLYLMMTVAAWLVWLRREKEAITGALAVYGLHLLFNAAWSPLFFGLRNPDAALVDAILLWATVAVNIAMFYHIRLLSGLLLVPVLLWVSFAVSLNAAIVALN